MGMLLIGAMVVSAQSTQVPLDSVTFDENPIQPVRLSIWQILQNLFSREGFLPGGQVFFPYSTPLHFDSNSFATNRNTVRTVYGEACNTYDYVRLYACTSNTQGAHCENLFTDDWQIEYPGEYLDLRKACDYGDCTNLAYMTQYGDWFWDAVYGRYIGYRCYMPPLSATINNYHIPSNSKLGEKVTVTLDVTFHKTGRYYLEAGLRESSHLQSIYGVGYSVCDGNIRYDGVYYDAIAGQRRTFILQPSDYGKTGSYQVDIVVTNGCGTGPNAVSYYQELATRNARVNIYTEDAPAPPPSDPPVSEWTGEVDWRAPTFYQVGLNLPSGKNLRDYRPGEQVPVVVTIRVPEGETLRSGISPGNLVGGSGTLHMEIGVYDKVWASQQGWIAEMKERAWWDRAWTVKREKHACAEDFVQTYSFHDETKLWGIFPTGIERCTKDHSTYNAREGACLLTVKEVDNKPITFELPYNVVLSDGTHNFNQDGEYVVVFGLYTDCYDPKTNTGGYYRNPDSMLKIPIFIGELKSVGATCEREGDTQKETCGDGKSIVARRCIKGEDGVLRWAATDQTCPEKRIDPDTTQLSLTIQQWNRATHEEILRAQCEFSYQCVQMEGYRVSCVSSPEIIERNKAAYQSTTPLFMERFSWFKSIFFETDRYTSGTCRATPETTIPQDYCNFLEPFAFFDITGDRCNDGLVVVAGAILILILLLSLLGGGHRR